MQEEAWIDVGEAAELAVRPVQQVQLGRTRIALTCKDGQFGAISGVCNHAGGPLGEGKFDGEYIVCPWHYWKFHELEAQSLAASAPSARAHTES